MNLPGTDDSMDRAHIYKLAGNQHIRFMKKSEGQEVYDGTTNEEVVIVLMDRIMKLNTKFPCFENIKAIAGLQMCLNALEERTQKRVAQGVEGQDKEHV